MTPIKFKGHNATYAKNQPPYLPLPAHVDEKEGIVTSCWKLTAWERMRVLFAGRIFVSMMTFNRPPMPVRPTTKFP